MCGVMRQICGVAIEVHSGFLVAIEFMRWLLPNENTHSRPVSFGVSAPGVAACTPGGIF